MPTPSSISELVDKFGRSRDAYLSHEYNETQLRREFLDPLFGVLGWDIENKQGYAEVYKDVIHEDAIKIGSATKAPDYSFRVGGIRKFFVEAKKPSVNLKEDSSPAYQLRRYAWSAKLPLSVLTDFQEFVVYDCRVKPFPDDKPSTGRTLYLQYTEYESRWNEIADVFSKDAVLKGSFDKYAETNKGKKGTAEVDDAFLQEIEAWRKTLAANIALRNSKLTQRELNSAVQRTIDRIIFLRICEDRGIETYGTLMAFQNGVNIYRRLTETFQRADEKYNSGLFHFQKEKDRGEAPDELTLGLAIDDKPLKDIIKNLYYPDSPYEFSVLPADILGQVYEQFLGKVIRLTTGHHAVVEDKPEVKKAGGVYYTPTYIVEYIVKNTVGKLVSPASSGFDSSNPIPKVLDKSSPNDLTTVLSPGRRGDGRRLDSSRGEIRKQMTPKQVSTIRILDPACGSGSFLIGAYQHLLDWHRDWYVKDGADRWTKGKTPALYQSQQGEWRLTTMERKRILLNNIYGVDIDAQAVETTKLSLLLKVLEGENDQTISRQLKMFQERALPDLGNNIKCGNSLIGPDFYNDDLFSSGGAIHESPQRKMKQKDAHGDERMRINAFDWKNEFKEIMGTGGFDAVIGNPPYVDIKGLPQRDVEYVFDKYPSANNRINLFAAFIEKVLDLVHPKRFKFSFIVPTALLTQESYKALRKKILEHYDVSSLVRLPNESFGSAAGEVKVDTVIFVLGERTKEERRVEVVAYSGYERVYTIDPTVANIHSFLNQASWVTTSDYVWSITSSASEDAILAKCGTNSVSLEDCAEFCLGLTPYDKYKGHSEAQIKDRVFHADHRKDKTFKKLLAGNDVMRYYVQWNGEEWISYGPWLGAPREQRFFVDKRILVKQIIDWTTKRIWATITDEEMYNSQNAFNLLPRSNYVLEYLLGILNSRLMTFYHRKKYLDEFKMRFQKILIKDCRRFPIHTINFSDPGDKSRHDKMVALVQQMLDLHKKLATSKLDHEQTALQRQIDATDTQIDALVYELYGLTEDEIKIVEGSTRHTHA